MPDTCCAVGCSNRREGDNKELSFYTIPSKKTQAKAELRARWVTAIKREDWGEEKISNARICGAHFVTGKKSNDPQHVDYVPTIFSFKDEPKEKSAKKIERYERLQRREKKVDDQKKAIDLTEKMNEVELEQFIHHKAKGTQTDSALGLSEIKVLKAKIVKQNLQLINARKDLSIAEKSIVSLRKRILTYNNVKNSYQLKALTGLEKSEVFEWILSLVSVGQVLKSLSLEDHLLLVLLKLRLGTTNADLAIRFNLKESTVSTILRTWIPDLSSKLKFLIVWPEKGALQTNLPASFINFKNCVCIIDCTEVYVERPLSLHARAQTYSNYKLHNTSKYLIGITPAGAVSFLSTGWGGRASDKEITIRSGYLDKVEHGDLVLADRGFLVEEELATRGAVLRVPEFTKGKKQMSSRDVDISRQISHVHIHVEQVIGRLKKFKIISTTIPISQVKLVDDYMVIICALVNLCPSVIPK